jgi:hypothetical protein
LHYAASTAGRDGQKEELWKFKIALMPCSSLSWCRGKNNEECEFIELRQEKEIWVKEKKKRGEQTAWQP